MNRPIVVAHLSDLHISAQYKLSNLRKTEGLLATVNDLNIDHIIITGDITSNADIKDYKLARSLFASFGLLDSKRLTVVIGNHDVFGGVHEPEDIFHFPRQCKETRYKRNVELFRTYFWEAFEETRTISNGPFPFIKDLAGVSIIGLNSIAKYSRVGNPFGSNGIVDQEQIAAAHTLFLERDGSKPVLIAIHHHFNKPEIAPKGTMQGVWSSLENQTMKLRKKRRLLALFQKIQPTLVLHGHVHENSIYARRNLQYVNGGGSILSDKDQIAQFNLIFLKGNEVDVQITSVGMIPESRELQKINNGLSKISQPVNMINN